MLDLCAVMRVAFSRLFQECLGEASTSSKWGRCTILSLTFTYLVDVTSALSYTRQIYRLWAFH